MLLPTPAFTFSIDIFVLVAFLALLVRFGRAARPAGADPVLAQASHA